MGVFLCSQGRLSRGDSLPHARGGVSTRPHRHSDNPQSSPRSWGCFRLVLAAAQEGWVFPTLVGVFPGQYCLPVHKLCLPHARGGVSEAWVAFALSEGSSPRSWGCFSTHFDNRYWNDVFPTLVGVFPFPFPIRSCLEGLPHARGGVSDHFGEPSSEKMSSPRSWGCFFGLRRG